MRRWYQRIKQRRGAKIARVAVMRRTAVIIWHMLSKQEAYRYGGTPAPSRRQKRLAVERAAAEEAQRQEVMAALGLRRPDATPAAATLADASPSSDPQKTTGSSSLGAGRTDPAPEAVPCQA